MKKLIAYGVLAAALGCAPAIAADLPKGPVYKAAPAPVFSWTGFYGGINGGYGWDPNYALERPAGTFDIPLFLEPQGAFGGIQIGYNWHYARNWLIGIEADFQFSDISDTYLFQYPGGGDSFVTLSIKQFATIRGRFAYVQDRNLFYFTGGVAFANFDVNAFIDFDANDGLFDTNKWKTGYVVGVGYERAFAGNWTLKLEYLFMDFGNISLPGIETGINGPLAIVGDPYFHLVRLGLNLRFATGRP
jgi:outer membrane immunogenic protein